MADVLLGFFVAHPSATAKTACEVLKIPYEKHKSLAWKQHSRAKHYRSEADPSTLTGKPRAGHRVTWGPRVLPASLASPLVVAAQSGRSMWRLVRAGADGRIPYYEWSAGICKVWLWPKSGKLLVRRVQRWLTPEERRLLGKSSRREERDVPPENVRRRVEEILLSSGGFAGYEQGELTRILDTMFLMPSEIHLPGPPIPAMEKAPKFRVDIPDYGVMLVHDGSDLKTVEILFRPPPFVEPLLEQIERAREQGAESERALADAVTELAKVQAERIERLEGGITELVGAIRQLLGAGGEGSEGRARAKPPDPNMWG